MQKISAVIITYNEEARIGACLASLEGVADEIVILDSFSTDATEAVCRQYNVKFYQQAWKGYGNQKNDAAALASHEHILSLDADEYLSGELKAAIVAAKQAGLTGVYKMSRLANYYGSYLRHGFFYPDYQHRLYNRSEIQWSTRLVHETLDIPATTVVTKLEGDLVHFSKVSIEAHIASINAYTTLGAQTYYDAGKRSSVLKIGVKPLFTFIQGYFFKMGFLDGAVGFIAAAINGYDVFLKYSKLLLLQRKNQLKNK